MVEKQELGKQLLGTSGSQTGDWWGEQIEGALNSPPARLGVERSRQVLDTKAWGAGAGEAEAACTIGTRLSDEATS